MEISYKRTHKESYMIISTEEYVSVPGDCLCGKTGTVSGFSLLLSF